MKLFDLYKWITGSMSDFTKPFQNNEDLFNLAKSFWRHLENSAIFTIGIFIFLGILLSVSYYGTYNNKPGRHYKPTHWLIFLCITFIVTLLLTLAFEYIAVPSDLQGATKVQFYLSLGNAIYASCVYFIVSVIWCNALPTNAYRIFKF